MDIKKIRGTDTLQFSPTAIALGSSAIVKVSGQNCFRTLSGSPGRIRLGLPKGFAEGSTKVSPRLHQSSSVSGSLRRIRLGLPKGSVVGCQKSFVEGSGFHRGCFTEVPHLSPGLVLGSKLHELTCLTCGSYPQGKLPYDVKQRECWVVSLPMWQEVGGHKNTIITIL